MIFISEFLLVTFLLAFGSAPLSSRDSRDAATACASHSPRAAARPSAIYASAERRAAVERARINLTRQTRIARNLCAGGQTTDHGTLMLTAYSQLKLRRQAVGAWMLRHFAAGPRDCAAGRCWRARAARACRDGPAELPLDVPPSPRTFAPPGASAGLPLE